MAHRLSAPPDYTRLNPDELNETIESPTPSLNQSSKPQSPPVVYNSLLSWGFELLTWLLGTSAVLAIIALAAFFNNRSIHDWHFYFQITTVFSALSQVAQSALLVSLSSCIGQLKWVWYQRQHPLADLEDFDDAGRGPWGSLQLLWKRRGA